MEHLRTGEGTSGTSIGGAGAGAVSQIKQKMPLYNQECSITVDIGTLMADRQSEVVAKLHQNSNYEAAISQVCEPCRTSQMHQPPKASSTAYALNHPPRLDVQ
jgi:hypothetical protein